MINSNVPAKPRGRPRNFDLDEVLAKATKVFWQLGYEGASIVDLTQAMGITPQSLYAAFGSKSGLYRQSLDYYQNNIGKAAMRALGQETTVIEALSGFLREMAQQFCQPDRPAGCMISTAILTCAIENDAEAAYVSEMRASTLSLIQSRIERGVAEGELQADTDVNALTCYLAALIQGMSVQAQDGASYATLLAIAEIACRTLVSYQPVK